jgi:hypothetical protein
MLPRYIVLLGLGALREPKDAGASPFYNVTVIISLP